MSQTWDALKRSRLNEQMTKDKKLTDSVGDKPASAVTFRQHVAGNILGHIVYKVLEYDFLHADLTRSAFQFDPAKSVELAIRSADALIDYLDLEQPRAELSPASPEIDLEALRRADVAG